MFPIYDEANIFDQHVRMPRRDQEFDEEILVQGDDLGDRAQAHLRVQPKAGQYSEIDDHGEHEDDPFPAIHAGPILACT